MDSGGYIGVLSWWWKDTVYPRDLSSLIDVQSANWTYQDYDQLIAGKYLMITLVI